MMDKYVHTKVGMCRILRSRVTSKKIGWQLELFRYFDIFNTYDSALLHHCVILKSQIVLVIPLNFEPRTWSTFFEKL